MDNFKTAISEFTNNLFPNMDTCMSYYVDEGLNSNYIVEQIIARTFGNPKEKIDKFDYNKYSTYNNLNIFKEYIYKNYIYNGLNSYVDILLETYTKNILFKLLANETSIKQNLNLFNLLLQEEINNLISFLENIPTQQSYILSSNNMVFEFENLNHKFNDDIIIKTTLNDSRSLIEIRTDDFDYIKFENYIESINTSFALIYGCNIRFEILDDCFSLYFKQYGCNEQKINGIRDYFFNRVYKNNLFGIKYKINETNFKLIEMLHSKNMCSLQNLEKDSYLKIAIDFYKDAIKEDKFGASKITYLMIALEALFNTDKNEISKTIRQRCIKLLQIFYSKEQVLQIDKDLKIAYGIRCSYAHGAKHTNPKAEIELVDRILEYTKTVIILCLQLNETYNKADINKLLDDSLLYEDENYKLQEALKKLIIYFVTDSDKSNIPIFDLKQETS